MIITYIQTLSAQKQTKVERKGIVPFSFLVNIDHVLISLLYSLDKITMKYILKIS